MCSHLHAFVAFHAYTLSPFLVLIMTRLNIGTELVGEGTLAMTGEGHQE